MKKVVKQISKIPKQVGQLPKKVAEFDYSMLSDAFNVLSKPARRALINNGIHTPKDLARFTVDTVAQMNGVGPEAIDAMMTILQKQRLKFKPNK
jgi:hypothetical protein